MNDSGKNPETAPEPAIGEGAARWIRADLVLLVASIAFLIWFLGPVLLLVFASILLAIAFDALTGYLVRLTGMPRGFGLAIVLLAFVTVLGTIVTMVVPSFAEQLGQIWERLSSLVDEAEDVIEEQTWLQDLLGLNEEGEASESISPTDVAARAASFTMTALGGAGAVIVMVAVAVFVAADPALYRAGVLKLVPKGRRGRGGEVLSAMGYSLRWWLLGQLVSMTVLGTVSALALWLVGVEAWFGLAVIVAVLTFIPFLGPIIAAIPVLALSFAEGLETGLIMLGVYLVLQNVEGNLLTPLVQQQAVHMPPALLVSVQLLLGAVFGFAGLMLAAPLAVLGLVAVNLLYVEDVLGDRPADLGDSTADA